MGIKKKLLRAALGLLLLLALSACRTRTGVGTERQTEPGSGTEQVSGAGETEEDRAGSNVSDSALRGESGEEKPEENAEAGAGGPTRENPEAARKEYDEYAPAEIVAGTDRILYEAGEGDGPSGASEEAAAQADLLNEKATEEALHTVAAEEAEQTGVSEDAEAADSAMTYYTVLLQDRMGSLFECQRLNVYWETEQDHVTVYKKSPEHALILNAGCYDVSARLLEENLKVDDGWVVRKNPGVIVKVTDSSVLGAGVYGTGAAEAVYESLRSRPGWGETDAVRNGRILLISRAMLEAPYLQTAAMVLVAQTANPALFADTDPDKMLEMLTEEATGTLPSGTFFCRPDP